MHKFDPTHHHILDSEERQKYQAANVLQEIINPQKNEILVDVGTGTGYYLFPLAKDLRMAVGVDISSKMLERAHDKQKLSDYPNVLLLCSRESNLPFYSNQVDIVLMANMLHEANNAVDLIKDIHRILKPGGRFITTDWKKIKHEFGPPFHHRISAEEAINILKKGGFIEVASLPGYEFHYILKTYKEKKSNKE
ncbi:MAG: class I SAM-dependent methyltransferase [Candidatus Hermodarchaeota archaeon]